MPWILGDFPRIGYYEHDNNPADLDGDFLLVEESKIPEVETKLRGHLLYRTVDRPALPGPVEAIFPRQPGEEHGKTENPHPSF